MESIKAKIRTYIKDILKSVQEEQPKLSEEPSKGCLMFYPNINTSGWKEQVLKLIPEEICKEYEFEPHVTVLYGFIDNELDKQKLKELVTSFIDLNPIDISLSTISIFTPKEYDVVKIGVIDNNGNLTKLNKLITENFSYQNDYPDYKPHFTLAYVQSGEGKQYEGIKIDETAFGINDINVGEMIYSDSENNKTSIATVLEAHEFNNMELLPVNELVYLDEQEIESLVKAEDINYAFDEGFISDDDYLAYQELKKAIGEITKGYDNGIVSEADFFNILEKSNDFEFVKGEDSYHLIDIESLNGLNKAEELGLLDPDASELEKGRKAMPVGAKAIWGGIHYLKTATGWKPVGKKRGHVKENHDFIHENEEKEKDHHTMVLDAGKMESEEWVKKHGSNLHSKYKQVHDYLHKERVKRERKQQEVKPTEESKPEVKEEVKPVEETKPEPTPEVKEEPKAEEPEQVEPEGNSLGLNISMYSEKSILITGETYKNLELLRNLKKEVGAGTWNKALNGWIFPASAKDKIMAAVGGKIDTSTAEGTKQKEAAIEMKNAVDTGTPVELPVTHTEPETKEETPAVEEPKTEEAKVTEITTNEDGKVEYTVETEDGTKATVTEEEIAIPPATDEKAQELINNATEENRAKTGKMLFGKEAGEQPISEKIEQEGMKDIKIEVKEFTTRSGKQIQALDFTGITQSDIQLANQNGILEKEKPYYIPDINEKFFSYCSHSLTYVKQDENSFIVSLNGDEDKVKHYAGNKESDYAVVSLDQLVAIEDYYYKKAKAQHALDKIEYLKKRGEDIRDWKESQLSYEKPFHYAYTTKEQQKKYTKEQWDNLSIDEKIAEFPYMKSHPFKFNKLSTLKDGQITYAKYRLYGELVDNNMKGKTSLEAYNEFRSVEKLAGYKGIDMKCQKEDNDSSYEKGRETSYGDSNLEEHLYDSHGVKIKAQNGKGLSEKQVEDIRTHLSKAYESFGDRSSMSKQFGLKISHAGDMHMHASKFSGVYIPSMKAIGVGNTYNSFGFTLAHEISHFLDNYAGKKQGRYFASDDYNSTAGKIASTFRKHMNKAQSSDYMNRTCECFARALEQYHALKHEGDDAIRFAGDKYVESGEQVNKEKFNTLIKPLIEQFLKENDHLLKSAYDELNLIDLNNSFELIKASFDNGEIEEGDFIDAAKKYEEICKSDPSHGGKLVKKVIINKMGKKETTWVKRGDEDNTKENENKAPNEPVKHSQKVLSAFAAETPESKLKEVINNSTDENLRRAAHAELDRRGKKEKPQEEKEKKVSKSTAGIRKETKKEKKESDTKESKSELSNTIDDTAKKAVDTIKEKFKSIGFNNYSENALITAAAVEFKKNLPDNICFHGTDTDFDKISLDETGKRDFGNLGSGFYVSSSPGISQSYAEDAAKKSSKSAILKTFTIDNSKFLDVNVASEWVKKELGISYPCKNKEEALKVKEFITSKGFDGVNNGSAEYAVFNKDVLKMGKTYNGLKDLLGLSDNK